MMSRRFENRTITNVEQFLRFTKDDDEGLNTELPEDRRSRLPVVWYRGLPSTYMKLLPTLYRDSVIFGNEIQLMDRFKQNAHEFLSDRPQGEWEWMLLARHHGLPSRLLDWSENPLVGLFFASEEHQLEGVKTDGALWCLSPLHLNKVANRQQTISDYLPMFSDEEEASVESNFLANYRTTRLPRGDSQVAVPPAAAISIRTNKRIQAQAGVFTIHHADTKPLEDWAEGKHVWKYIIPEGAKKHIRTELRRLGIIALTLFPDLDNVAEEARRER